MIGQESPLSHEMVGHYRHIKQTEASITLNDELKKIAQGSEGVANTIRAQMKRQRTPGAAITPVAGGEKFTKAAH